MGYLEWGEGNSSFLVVAELEILQKMLTAPASVLHPFVILPLAGQVLWLVALCQSRPNRWLIYAGMFCVGILLGFMLVVGVLAMNWKIVLSVLPFWAVVVGHFVGK